MSDLPQEWVETTFSEIFDHLQYGLTAKADSAAQGTRFLRITDIHNGMVSWDSVPGLVGEHDLGRYLLADGDFVFARSGSIEKAARLVNPPNAVFASYLIRARPLIPQIADYLAYFVRSDGYLAQIADRAAGIGMSNVNAAKLGTIAVSIPPLPEQRRIVAKIDSLTGKSRRARDHLDHIPRLVEKYKQAILTAAFRGDLTREWRHGQRNLAAVQPRDPSEIRSKYATTGHFLPPYVVPDSWSWLRLLELGELDRGKSRHRPRNDARLFGGSYPFIQTGEVRQAERFLINYNATYSDFGLAQSRLWPVGTVCITIAANIAETAILGIDACFPDSVVGFLPDGERIDGSFAEFFLRTARDELSAFAPATAQKNINLDILASVRLPVPSLEEQAEIVRRIESAFGWIDRLSTDAASARKLIDHLDQSVLAKAFKGELVPQDPADEPARVLLDRIRAERTAAPKAKRGRRKAA